MPRGPQSDAILVNILLDNELPDLLAGWLADGVSWPKIAGLVNARVAAMAARSGAPTRVFAEDSPKRWSEFYGLTVERTVRRVTRSSR